MVPSQPDKNLCRTVDVSADSPTRLMLPRIAARMGDEGKAVGSRTSGRRLCYVSIFLSHDPRSS